MPPPWSSGRAASAGLVAVVAAFASAFAASGATALPRDCRTGAAPCAVDSEAELRAAWGNPATSAIVLRRDVYLRQCETGDPIREAARPLRLDGGGHTIRQTCFEKRVLRQDGTGALRIEHVTLTRGGSDGPGAGITSRGEITLVDAHVLQNLAEEPGGGVFSMRGVTAIRSVITGNLANDDGGGIYARRGGVRVYDSVVSNNLVDGSGGAIGSTGDILVVRSHVDGNTTDGDGGALYADEDGDVTVVDSSVDGNTADGPGGAVFTLDGDVMVVRSTMNGNRADDRGGAISGEADVTVIGSTIARNAAVAHVGGGIWARGNLHLATTTLSNNYAEGQGGGALAAGVVRLDHVTILDNVAPVAANLGAGARLEAFASVIGPARVEPFGGEVQPTATGCRVTQPRSLGYNAVNDSSCGLRHATDFLLGPSAVLSALGDNGGIGETRVPLPGGGLRDRIPAAVCDRPPFPDMLAGHPEVRAAVASTPPLVVSDARGVVRKRGQACDIGAVEVTS